MPRKKKGSESADGSSELERSNKQQRRGSPHKKKRNKNKIKVNDEQFREALEADGSKVVIDMAADGNCLFRSISDQLYWDYGDKHEEVRSEVCDYMAAHEDDFSVFLVLDENEQDEDAADFESYIAGMRELGEWGGNLELVAAARLYRRNVKVFSEAAAYTIDHGATKSSGPDLQVSYHDNDHYNSVRDNKAKKKSPVPLQSSSVSETTDSTAPLTEEEGSDTKDEEKQEGIETKLVEEPPVVIKKKKGGKCPCGSGLSYRKCCRGKMSVATLSVKVKLVDDEAEPQHQMESGFKVLKI